jgi:hypothetical protein
VSRISVGSHPSSSPELTVGGRLAAKTKVTAQKKNRKEKIGLDLVRFFLLVLIF